MSPQLQRIVVEGSDLYLPTNHRALVESINTNSGRPLQSAAKVPIMVTFNVNIAPETRDDDTDSDDADGEPCSWHEPSRSVPQACIFKVPPPLPASSSLRDSLDSMDGAFGCVLSVLEGF